VFAKMKSVQEYIDERPIWPDGTHLPAPPMTNMQWLIWSLAATGKFFVGYVVFMTGVALPLISREFGIGSAEHGLIGAAGLLGMLVGAVGLGSMSDHFGRKPMFIVEMIIFVAFLVLLILCSNFLSVVICLFGIGLALGCDYPTAHMIISESIPSLTRGRLVLAAFGFQAVGALAGTLVGFFVLSSLPDLSAWRWMYATVVIPALAVTIGRFYVTESANWLHARGAVEKAQRAATRLLVRRTQYPANIMLLPHSAAAAECKRQNRGFAMLLAPQNRRDSVHFIALPPHIWELSQAQIQTIK
jgi:MFS transporter, putative metabolite transport protein